MSTLPSLVLLTSFLLLSAFFSGTESAYTSLSATQVAMIKNSYGKRGRLVARLVARPDKLLTTVLIGNNLVNIAASALATQLTIRVFGNHAIGIMTGLLTLVVLIFAEVTPKQVALANNVFICVHTARLIFGLELLLRPVVLVVGSISSVLAGAFKGRGGATITLDGLLHVVRQAENLGILEAYKSRVVKNTVRFSSIPVSAIMTHRTDVFSLEQNTTIAAAMRAMAESGYARAPVYNLHPEQIVGVVLARDLMRKVESGDDPIRTIMWDPIFIPEHRRIDQALTQLQQANLNLAVVLDEYGGVAGIVTTEDIVEEIVGEMYDEHETREQDKIVRIGARRYSIRADIPLTAVNDFLPVPLQSTDNAATLAGYLTELIGHIPTPAERIETTAGLFEVASMDKNRVVLVTYTSPAPRDQENFLE